MTPTIIKYPEDFTGRSLDNLVAGEKRDVPAELERAFAPRHGAFYSASVKIFTSANKALVPNVDFKCVRLHPEATLRAGQEVCTAIWITNKAVAGKVRVDYQVVGGEFSASTSAIMDSIEDLQLDNRNVEWENGIIGKPTTYPPSPHLHPLSQIYGFEYVVDVLERLNQSILTGDAASHELIYNKIRMVMEQVAIDVAALQTAITEANNYIRAHMIDRTNPHEVTAVQVGLGLVPNFSMATNDEHLAGSRTDRFTNPQGVANKIAAYAYPRTGGVVNGSVTANGITSMGNVYSGNGASFFQTNGDSYGGVWGGLLSNYLNNNFVRGQNGVTSIRLTGLHRIHLSGGYWNPTIGHDGSCMVGWGVEGSRPADDAMMFKYIQQNVMGNWITIGG